VKRPGFDAGLISWIIWVVWEKGVVRDGSSSEVSG
jgi:hypothetical protein